LGGVSYLLGPQAATAAFVRAAGAENSVAEQMELVLEEILTNVIEHGYLPGQRERIDLTLGIDGQFFVLTMRFKGIPFDIDYLRQCERANLKNVLQEEAIRK
jgi:anti-sigma regulatory factor (Ser/Thr protein kinase)